MGLTAWLLTGDRAGVSRQTLLRRLRSPWGFPAAAQLAERARAHAAGVVESLGEGEVLVVSVGVEGLWHLRPRRTHADDLELRGAAAASALLARRLVTRDLPLYDDVARLHRGVAFYAKPFAVPPTASPPTALDGPSYGLSLSLATASDALRLPVAADLAATGVLQADGSVARVEGLARKVALILEEAPGITRFLVPAEQYEEACEAAQTALLQLEIRAEDGWLQIVPVGTFHEAFERAFPAAQEHLRKRWEDPVIAKRLARELHRMALFDSPIVLGWPAIARCAHELATQSLPPAELQRLHLVHAIALRHGGNKNPLPWPDDADLRSEPRASRLRHLAQVVQAAAEEAEDPGSAADRARAMVRPALERAAEDAVLLGAMGRAYGAAERDDDALVALREAVDTWHEVGCSFDSTHALCELLRQLGMAGNAELVLAVSDNDVPLVEADPRTSDKSLGFLRVALGRAYVQVGRFDLGLAELREAPEGRALPLIAEGGRLRWLAVAHDGFGNRKAADDTRAKLAARKDAPYAWRLQVALARLDAARRDGAVDAGWLDGFGDLPELALARRRCPPGRDLALHLTERSRY